MKSSGIFACKVGHISVGQLLGLFIFQLSLFHGIFAEFEKAQERMADAVVQMVQPGEHV